MKKEFVEPEVEYVGFDTEEAVCNDEEISFLGNTSYIPV